VKLLLRAYPRRWRERYGDELLALLEAEPVTWRGRANVLAAGLMERVRGSGQPQLRVLWGWSLFVLGGLAFQKVSEHWGAAVPASQRAIPDAAYATVVAAAIVGGFAVLAGVASALPAFARDLRAGGWLQVRRAVSVATATSALAALSLVSLALHHDLTSASIFVWSALASLLLWTHAAVVAARRLPVLRVQTYLSWIVTAAMAVMAGAGAIWFRSMSLYAPSVVSALQLAVVATFMLGGLALGGFGTFESLSRGRSSAR
jgi:hypothetical protein